MNKAESVIYLAAGILLAFLISGCTAQAGTPSFWTQCIKADGWGLNLISPYGVVNAGKLVYSRNVNCANDRPASDIVLPLPLAP